MMLTQFVVALLVAIGMFFLILVATFRSLTGRTHLLSRATDRHSDAELKAGFVAAVGWGPQCDGARDRRVPISIDPVHRLRAVYQLNRRQRGERHHSSGRNRG